MERLSILIANADTHERTIFLLLLAVPSTWTSQHHGTIIHVAIFSVNRTCDPGYVIARAWPLIGETPISMIEVNSDRTHERSAWALARHGWFLKRSSRILHVWATTSMLEPKLKIFFFMIMINFAIRIQTLLEVSLVIWKRALYSIYHGSAMNFVLEKSTAHS